MTASEIVNSVAIRDVWSWLGGGKLRSGRGQAFWRQGDSWSVVLGDGRWFDHRDGVGGGVLDLIIHVRAGTRQEAMRWLADMSGQALDDSPAPAFDRRAEADTHRVQQEAELFAWAVIQLAEMALEELPSTSPARMVHTKLIQAVKISPETTYRAWLEDQPAMAKALVQAGKMRNERIDHLLASYVLKPALIDTLFLRGSAQ